MNILGDSSLILHPSSFVMNLLDVLATQFPDSSRTTLRQLLQHGRVRVNGEVEKDARREIAEDETVDISQKAVNVSLPPTLGLLYEDDDLLVVLKSAGLSTTSRSSS